MKSRLMRRPVSELVVTGQPMPPLRGPTRLIDSFQSRSHVKTTPQPQPQLLDLVSPYGHFSTERMNPGLCIILYSKSAQLTLPSGEITLREGEKVDLDSWTWRRDRNLHSRDEASRKNPLSFDVWTGNAYIRSRRAKSHCPEREGPAESERIAGL